MEHILRNLIALGLVLGLFLPVGWCCQPVQTQTADSPAPHGCCGQASTSRPMETPGIPAPPVRACCCVMDLSVPSAKADVPQLLLHSPATFSEVASPGSDQG
ncbi:MAG TPA: hypothetical protein VL475_12765, partial [Planctomycetaceae bacterium]|nr:hypothetical protein [Planctomycetaceae bacterium]